MCPCNAYSISLIYRKKIPHECKSQRNCQLFVVVAAIVVTLATSFTPNVDWAAHAGGALQVRHCELHFTSLLCESRRICRHWCFVKRAYAALVADVYRMYILMCICKPCDVIIHTGCAVGHCIAE